LLATRMVANKCSGEFRFSSMYKLLFDGLLLSLCFSAGLNEKYATSDPETKADNINKNIITKMLIATPVVNG